MRGGALLPSPLARLHALAEERNPRADVAGWRGGQGRVRPDGGHVQAGLQHRHADGQVPGGERMVGVVGRSSWVVHGMSCQTRHAGSVVVINCQAGGLARRPPLALQQPPPSGCSRRRELHPPPAWPARWTGTTTATGAATTTCTPAATAPTTGCPCTPLRRCSSRRGRG